MQDLDIINLWKSYDKRLEENLSLNKKNAEDIIKLKARTFIVSMSPIKIFTIITGLIWVAIIDTIVVNLLFIANPYFLISAGLQSMLTTIAIGIYVYQSFIIMPYDISEPILETQKKLANLKLSTLWSAKILFLQLPFWTTFYWNSTMLTNWSVWLFILQFIITASFTYLAIWLFLNIKYENRNKKWFRFIFSGIEWDPIMKSAKLLDELKEYETNDQMGK